MTKICTNIVNANINTIWCIYVWMHYESVYYLIRTVHRSIWYRSTICVFLSRTSATITGLSTQSQCSTATSKWWFSMRQNVLNGLLQSSRSHLWVTLFQHWQYQFVTTLAVPIYYNTCSTNLLQHWQYQSVTTLAVPICYNTGSTNLLQHLQYQFVTTLAVPIYFNTGSTNLLQHWQQYQFVTTLAVPICYNTGSTNLLQHWQYQFVTTLAVPICYNTGSTNLLQH